MVLFVYYRYFFPWLLVAPLLRPLPPLSCTRPCVVRGTKLRRSVVRAGGTFVLRNTPGRTVLLPLPPAWKLRAMSAKELLEVAAAE